MDNVTILGTRTNGNNLYVGGTIDGIKVEGQGLVSEFNKLSTDYKKMEYLKTMLIKALPANTTVQAYLNIGLHMRVWLWLCNRSEHIMISIGVYVLGSIAQHIFYHYVPLIEHLLHVNLSFLQ